jgi:outer membrane protein assembly factor BamB
VKLNRLIVLSAMAAVLIGCAKKEEILQGQRFDIRTPLDQAVPTEDGISPSDEIVNRSEKIKLPKQQNLSSWTHRNGGADHALSHLALSTDLTHLWSASIGKGNDRKHRITSDPIIAGGLIFTLDSQSTVMAHSPIGAAVWERNLTPPSEKTDEATGGGLAYRDGVVYATTGFGIVTALNAADGAVIWEQKLGAAVTAPPMVTKTHVYVVSRDNRAWAILVKNGRVDWQQKSTTADAGLMGGASPASAGRTVILPFSSGEMIAALTGNGLRVWSTAVSGSRRGQARSNIGDISSDPVVTNGRVYAANQAGRMIAVDRRSGERLWTANEGSYSPVWPVGNAVFLVSDDAQLVRLDARDGSPVWAVDLPKYRKEKTHKGSFAHFGPVLAGGRLLVASGDGSLRSYDPESGALLSEMSIPGGAASHVAIVDGVLYILSQNGQLHAYR